MMKKVSILLCVVLFLAACSSETTPDEETFPRNLTTSEAQIFARALNTNHVNKTAEFQAVPLSNNGDFLLMKGVIDWEANTVSNEIYLSSLNKIDITSVNTADGVYESFDELTNVFTRNHHDPTLPWALRPEYTDTYRNDVISSFLKQLIATTPENPQLVRQDGTKLVSIDEIDNEKVYVFEKSGNIQYFVNEKSEIKRLILQLKLFSTPIRIDFSNYSKATLDLPDKSEAHSIDAFVEDYGFNRPGF